MYINILCIIKGDANNNREQNVSAFELNIYRKISFITFFSCMSLLYLIVLTCNFYFVKHICQQLGAFICFGSFFFF